MGFTSKGESTTNRFVLTLLLEHTGPIFCLVNYYRLKEKRREREKNKLLSTEGEKEGEKRRKALDYWNVTTLRHWNLRLTTPPRHEEKDREVRL